MEGGRDVGGDRGREGGRTQNSELRTIYLGQFDQETRH